MANVLIVGPHPDDAEFSMGGSIALLAAHGHRVLLLDVTDGEPTPAGDPATRAAEAARAAEILSTPHNQVRRRLLGLPNRTVTHSVEARHMVAGVIRAFRADALFIPYPEDAHPDHLAVTRIAEDARFDAKLSKLPMPGDDGQPPIHPARVIYYFATHLRIIPQPSFILDVSPFEAQRRAAVLAYHSQVAANPRNTDLPAWLDRQAAYFGSRIGVQSGEPFWVREPLGLRDFQGVIGL